MKVSQMGLHPKNTAEDWYWGNQVKLEAGTWNEVEIAFLKRFERSKMSYALDLQQMQQEPGEKVCAFATRFNQVASYLSSDKELEVLSFRDKLLPEYRERVDIAAPENMEEAVRVATRAEECMETDRRQQEALDKEVKRVLKTRTSAPAPAQQRASAPVSAPRPPPMNARYPNGPYNTGNNYRPGSNQSNSARDDTNRGSWQTNTNTTTAAPPQQNTSSPPAVRPQAGTQRQGARNLSQHQGAFCQMCGQHGHNSSNCTSAPHQAMVVTAATGTGLAADADVTISSQRPAHRQGFDVTHQSVQRPVRPSSEGVTTIAGLAAEADVAITSQRPPNRQGFKVSCQSVQGPAPSGPVPSAPRQHDISGALSQAQVTLPLSALASLPGVSAGLAKHFRDPKHTASMAETITTDDPTTLCNTERIHDAMRFATGQVSLNGNDCANSVVDTGASLSMVDEAYVDACGLTSTLEDIDLTYLMASGQSRRSGKILRNAQVQLGLLTFAVDLVVTTSPIFDLLLGNDLLSQASAVLVDQQVIRVSDLSHGQECTATLVLNVRTMTPSPVDPPVPLQSPPSSAGRTPNVDPVDKRSSALHAHSHSCTARPCLSVGTASCRPSAIKLTCPLSLCSDRASGHCRMLRMSACCRRGRHGCFWQDLHLGRAACRHWCALPFDRCYFCCAPLCRRMLDGGERRALCNRSDQ